MSFEADTVGDEDFAVNKIAAGVADEGVVQILPGKSVAPVDGSARCASEIAGGASTAFDGAADESSDTPASADYAPGFFGADAVDFGGRTVDGNAIEAGRHGVERIS